MTEAAGTHHVGLAALRELAPALDDLAAAAGSPVTSRSAWWEIWARTHPEWEPWVVAVTSSTDDVTSISLDGAVLLASARRGPWIRLVGLGHGTSDDMRLLARTPDAADRLGLALSTRLAAMGRPWSLLVEQLPADDPVVARITAGLPHRRATAGQGMPMVAVGDRSIGTYLSRNARSAENKARNRLIRDGRTLTERWVTDPVEVAAAVPAMSAVHQARDRQLGRASDHADPRRAAFYEQVLVEHARRGEVDLLLLSIDDDLAAYVAAFRDGRALRVWDNRVSPQWADYSAGRLANHAAIRRVVLDGDYDVLDWMRGEEPYKLSSATEIVPTITLEAWSSPLARAPYAAKEAAGRLLRRLPAADRVARQMIARRGKDGQPVDSNGA